MYRLTPGWYVERGRSGTTITVMMPPPLGLGPGSPPRPATGTGTARCPVLTVAPEEAVADAGPAAGQLSRTAPAGSAR